MVHGVQDILEAAHVSLPVLGLDSQILFRQLLQQIAEIVDDRAQSLHQRVRGLHQHPRLIFAPGSGHGRFQIPFYEQFHPVCTGFHRFADAACQDHGDHNGDQCGYDDHNHVDHDVIVCSAQIVQLRRSDCNAPSVRIFHGSISRKHSAGCTLVASKTVLPAAHRCMDRSQILHGSIALCLLFDILNHDRIKRDIGDRIAGLIDHISPAVFPDLNGRDDIV